MFKLKQELFWLSQECSSVIPLQMLIFDNKQTHYQVVMVLMSVLTTGNCWSHRIMPTAGQCSNVLNNLVNNTGLYSWHNNVLLGF